MGFFPLLLARVSYDATYFWFPVGAFHLPTISVLKERRGNERLGEGSRWDDGLYSPFRLESFFLSGGFFGQEATCFRKLSRTLFLVDFGGQKRTLYRIGKWRTQEMGFAACFAVWLGLFGYDAYGKGLACLLVFCVDLWRR